MWAHIAIGEPSKLHRAVQATLVLRGGHRNKTKIPPDRVQASLDRLAKEEKAEAKSKVSPKPKKMSPSKSGTPRVMC